MTQDDFNNQTNLDESENQSDQNSQNQQNFSDIVADNQQSNYGQNKPTTKNKKPSYQAGEFDKAYSEYFRAEQEKAAQKTAAKHNLPYVNLMGYSIASSVIQTIPEEIAQKYYVISYSRAGDDVSVAIVDPANQNLIKYLENLAKDQGFNLKLYVCSLQSIQYALKTYSIVGKRASNLDLEMTQEQTSQLAQEIKSLEALKSKISQVPTTQLFEIIVSGALENRASDIHIEPVKNGMNLRYRIDGVLQDVIRLNQDAYKALRSRIKYLAGMKLDISDKAQDGRFTIQLGDTPIDLRVSTLPTVWGENIVARLLSHGKGFLDLEKLGFTDRVKNQVEEAIKKPTGIILNTGPTGSGKSTTLYAILAKLNKPGIKIVTLEDPVEYRIPGISQTQIDSETGMDFAAALKYTLRQDPDIILVGEIRDGETASTSIDAGLTGHLVLSTLHTNNAASALTRLIDLGVRPFLLPGVIRLIIAQRLVRELCDCKEVYNPNAELKKEIIEKISKYPEFKNLIEKDFQLYKPKGCSKCNSTGFVGRIPIAESIKPSASIEELVINKNSTSKIYEQALKDGMIPMEIDGLIKAVQGKTTVEEVWRVTRE